MTTSKQRHHAPTSQPMETRHVTLTYRRALDLYNALAALDGRSEVRGDHVVTVPFHISNDGRLAIGSNRAILRTIKDIVEETQNGILLELSGGVGVLMPTIQGDEGRDIPNPVCAEYHRRILDLMNRTVDVDLMTIRRHDILPEGGDVQNEIPPSAIEHLVVILTGV